MFWIIGLIVTVAIMVTVVVLACKDVIDMDDVGPELIVFFDGLAIGIFAIAVVIFSCSYSTRSVYISKYQQQEKQIVYNLKVYSDNANFCNQFASTMSDANSYNLEIINEQQTYKSIGNLFTYRPKEVLNLPLIDVTKYKVTDSNINMKISN